MSILEAFETLRLDPNNELTQKDLQIAYHVSIMRAHPDKAPTDELSQQKGKRIISKINFAGDIAYKGI